MTQELMGNAPTVPRKLLKLTLRGCLIASECWNIFYINPSTLALSNGQVYMCCHILQQGKTFCWSQSAV